MANRLGELICIALGIATVAVPVVASNMGNRLGTYTAIKQARLERGSIEPITIQPYTLEPMATKSTPHHEDCLWSQDYDTESTDETSFHDTAESMSLDKHLKS